MSRNTLALLVASVSPVAASLMAPPVATVAPTVAPVATDPAPQATETETPEAKKRRLKRERDARYRANKKARQAAGEEVATAS